MRVKIKPVPGRVLRDHNNKMRIIPEEGKEVDWDLTWARRVRDGDAVKVADEPIEPVFKPVAAKAQKKDS